MIVIVEAITSTLLVLMTKKCEDKGITHHVVGLYRWSKKCYFEFLVVLFNPFWYYRHFSHITPLLYRIIAHFYHVTQHLEV